MLPPCWPAWNTNILESDVDYDVCDVLRDECGFNLHANWEQDGPVAREVARLRMDAGLFSRLFDRYKECGRYYKRYGGAYFIVILVTLGMRCGARISSAQLGHARAVYRSAGLFQTGIRSFELALRKYRNGRPYDMGGKGLYYTQKENELIAMMTNTVQTERTWGSGNGHTFGGRYFEAGVPTSEIELKAIDENRPPACDHCGKTPIDLPKDTKMKRCGKCLKVCYCSAECQKHEWKCHKKNCNTPEQQAKLNAEGKGEGMYLANGPSLLAPNSYGFKVHAPKECDCADTNCMHAQIRKHFAGPSEDKL